MVVLATILALSLPAGVALAQQPAGVDQYLPQPPGQNPGDGGLGAGNAGGPSQGVPGAGAAPAAQPGTGTATGGGHASGGGEPGGGAAPTSTGGADDAIVPLIDYPATSWTLAIIALLVVAIAARLAFAGYQRASRTGA